LPLTHVQCRFCMWIYSSAPHHTRSCADDQMQRTAVLIHNCDDKSPGNRLILIIVLVFYPLNYSPKMVINIRKCQAKEGYRFEQMPPTSGLSSSDCHKVEYSLLLLFTSSFFLVALRPNAGHGLLMLEVSRSHTTT
jgi:hypothetical protein